MLMQPASSQAAMMRGHSFVVRSWLELICTQRVCKPEIIQYTRKHLVPVHAHALCRAGASDFGVS